MTIGISKERLEELLGQGLPGVIDFKSQCLGVIAILLRDECKELNPWQPIDENTPKDRPVLYFYPITNMGMEVLITTESPMTRAVNYREATHWQELPEDPK